jgi:spore germination protein YaaH
MNKIKEEQLSKIKDQATKTNQLLNEIGYLESQKHQLLHNLAQLNEEINNYKQELEKEYGQVNINLEDGSYEDIKEEELQNV